MSNVLVTEIIDHLEILPLNLQHHILEMVRALSCPFKNEASADNVKTQLTNMENQQQETAWEQVIKLTGTRPVSDVDIMSKAIEGDYGRIIIDASLIIQVDNAASESEIDRTTFIQDALRAALQTFQTRKLEEQHRRGYELYPVDLDEFNTWDSNAAWGGE